MADVTVKQLADTVGAPTDRLLRQMKEAGLSHTAETDVVTEEQKQSLLAYLKRSHGAAEEAPRKVTLKRKSTGTLKAGQGRGGRNVTVEVRRKRTYVKAAETAAEPEAAAPSEERGPSQSELEAQRIHEQEASRKEAEEKERKAEAERKDELERRAEEERLAAEEAARREEEERAAKAAEEEQARSAAQPE